MIITVSLWRILWSHFNFIETPENQAINEERVEIFLKSQELSVDNTPDVSSICIQSSNQEGELESTKQSEISEVEVNPKYVSYEVLVEKIKSKTVNDEALKTVLSQASRQEMLVPTAKDMGMREYIKKYKEIQNVRKIYNII